jgi:hypothetical protein
MLAWKKTTLMALLVAAAILTFVAFILSISAISLQRWMSYDTLDAKIAAPSQLPLFSRWRGMFMECLKNEDHAKYVDSPDPKKTDSCYALDMGGMHPNADDANYWHIIRLRRGHVAMMILGIISLFAALLLIIAALAMTFLHKYYATRLHHILIRTALGVCIFSILCFLATLFIFHVLMDEEKYRKTNLLTESYSNWFSQGVSYTVFIRYASAYYLTWATLALLGLATLMLLTLLCWGLDRLFATRTVRTVEEKTIITGGGGVYGQPSATVVKGETVQTSTTHTNEAGRTHPGDSAAPYSYTGVSTTNNY